MPIEPIGTSAQARRIIAASRDALFAAWTVPENLTQWWGSESEGQCTVCETDARVGGRFRLGMYVPSEDAEYIIVGEYREISPPSRLVFTWCSERGDLHVTDTLVVVEFHKLGSNRTEVVVTHSRLPEGESSRYSSGWQGALERLAEYMMAGRTLVSRRRRQSGQERSRADANA